MARKIWFGGTYFAPAVGEIIRQGDAFGGEIIVG